MDQVRCKDADDFAYWFSITDPFCAGSYVAWLDRWNDNNGREVYEDGAHAPCDMG